MGFVPTGGYVVTTGKSDYRRVVRVDDETLSRIAEILGIPEADRGRLIADARSIFIYRGGGRSEPKR